MEMTKSSCGSVIDPHPLFEIKKVVPVYQSVQGEKREVKRGKAILSLP
jgi:hypothetical protein